MAGDPIGAGYGPPGILDGPTVPEDQREGKQPGSNMSGSRLKNLSAGKREGLITAVSEWERGAGTRTMVGRIK